MPAVKQRGEVTNGRNYRQRGGPLPSVTEGTSYRQKGGVTDREEELCPQLQRGGVTDRGEELQTEGRGQRQSGGTQYASHPGEKVADLQLCRFTK